MSLDEKVMKLVGTYGHLKREVLPKFLQDPSTNNLEVRDQIISREGRPMVNDPPGFVRDQLNLNIISVEKTLQGVINEPGDIYNFITNPEKHGNKKPKPLLTEEAYAAYKKEVKLSPDGEKKFYMAMAQNKTIQKELMPLLKAKEPEKFKEYIQEWRFAQAIKGYLAQGNVDAALGVIQQVTGANVITLLAGDYMRYGNPEGAKLIVNDIAQAAEKRAAASYETAKGDLAKAVDKAIQKTGTMGYVEAMLDWNAIYAAEAQQEHHAPQRPKLYAVPNDDDGHEQGAA